MMPSFEDKEMRRAARRLIIHQLEAGALIVAVDRDRIEAGLDRPLLGRASTSAYLDEIEALYTKLIQVVKDLDD